MTEAQWIAVLNSTLPPLIIVLVLTVTVILTVRWVRALLERIGRGRKVPILLSRDWLLFISLAVLIVGGQFARFTGINLGQQLWWVVLTDALSLATALTWLLIELGIWGKD